MSDETVDACGRLGAPVPYHPPSISYACPGRSHVKRLFDVVVAAALCVVLFPLLIVIAVVLRLNSRGPILFIQYRRGLNGVPFRIVPNDVHGRARRAWRRTSGSNDPRVTRFGSFLRRSSLDELPQVFNVLRGDMSLVGPRPHAIGTHIDGCTLPKVCSRYMLRYAVHPGITGWAQVNGFRGAMTRTQDLISRVDQDMFYIENATLGLDIRIIVITAMMVCMTRNAF